MKISTLAIALSGALVLTACGKANDGEKPASATTPPPVAEQGAPASADEAGFADRTVQAGKETWEKTKEITRSAADNVATTSGEIYESAKEAAVEAGEAVSEKSAEYYDAAKETTSDMVDATQEKGAEMLDSMNKD